MNHPELSCVCSKLLFTHIYILILFSVLGEPITRIIKDQPGLETIDKSKYLLVGLVKK